MNATNNYLFKYIILSNSILFKNQGPFAKVKFSIPPFNGSYDAEANLDWEMTIEQKFSSHLVPEQHRVRQATPLVSLKILLLSGGMNWLPLGYNHIHVMG
jgi:hypothetical protein